MLEFGHTVCMCHALYTITVSQYGKFWLLNIPPQSLNVAILFSGFIGPIEQVGFDESSQQIYLEYCIQGWFALRIYKFSNKIILPLFCIFLAAIRFIGSIALSIVAFHRLTLAEYTLHWTWLLTSILVIGAATDVILATSLCYYLSRWRGAGFERFVQEYFCGKLFCDTSTRTTRLVDRLMMWSIGEKSIISLSTIT